MAARLRSMFLGSSDASSSSEIHMPICYSNWKIPEQNLSKIYVIGLLDFKTALSIKTREETIPIREEFQTTSLLSHIELRKYLNQGYRCIHYGLVQVAIKPLAPTGGDARIYLALRDGRLKRYETSLLSMIQTDVCNGPIYFNCAADFSVVLTDPWIKESLILDVHLQGDEFKRLCKNFAIMYRVYFRLLPTTLNPKVNHFLRKNPEFNMVPTPEKETILFHVEASQPRVFISKKVRWDEITIPQEFQIQKPQPPRNLIPHEFQIQNPQPPRNLVRQEDPQTTEQADGGRIH